MAIPTHTLDDGRQVKLGKHPPRHDPRTLRLASYLGPELPPAPDLIQNSAVVPTWPMFQNDIYGDCTCAGAAHLAELWTAMSGTEAQITDADVLRMYAGVTQPSFNPGPPPQNDDGAIELNVLNWWRHNPIGDEQVYAFASIDPTNLEHVRQAIALLGGVYIGVGLPRSAQAQVGSLWDVVGDPQQAGSPAAPWSWGGHCVIVTDADWRNPNAPRLGSITWGAGQSMTDRFWAAYCDECWACIPTSWAQNPPRVPGFDFAALSADLAALGTPQASA